MEVCGGNDRAAQALDPENAGMGKRGPEADADPAGTKKRRKQLKPVRIAALDTADSLPSNMVQVPKDDVAVVIREPATVPQAKPPRCPLRDVPFQNDNLSDCLAASNVPSPETGPSGPSLPLNPLTFPYQPWTDRNKIFNQEAYCELCKKEFCNKYFLKTHKANKHGIFTDTPSVRQYVEPTVALTEPLMEEVSNHNDDDRLKAYCDLCNKSFCNKYFVRRHKSRTHGIEDLEDVNAVQSFSTNDARSTLNVTENSEDVNEEPLNLVVNADSDGSEDGPPETAENLEKLETMLMRLHPDEQMQEDNTDESESEPVLIKSDGEGPTTSRKQSKPTSSYCEICNKELCNKYFMRTHMQRMHGIELEHGTQIGGVVCNICNKELCSKYFLRVHKQNTHGIPSGLPSMRTDAKTPPRPNFSQVCLICSKRFRSSKWLQAHLQSDHREVQQDGSSDAPVDVISKLLWESSGLTGPFSCSQCSFTTPVLAFLFVHERSHVVAADNGESVKPSLALQDLIHHKTFWQHAITQPMGGLDLTAQKTQDS